MKRVSVSSSNIASVGYDDKSNTLEIEFHSGHIYQYFDVPRAIFDEIIIASSVGKYFHGHIKGIYRYART